MFLRTTILFFVSTLDLIFSQLSYYSIGALSNSSFIIQGSFSSNASATVDLLINGSKLITTTTDQNGNFQITANNLTPATTYSFDLNLNGNPLNLNKTITTFPSFGNVFNKNISIIASSASQSNSKSSIYNNILNSSWNLFFHLGDMHSDSVTSGVVNDYTKSWTNVLSSSYQKNLYQSVPLVYTFNELDLSPRNAYQQIFPSYPLIDTQNGIYQQFFIGSVMVLLTDSRTYLSAANNTMFGINQTSWLISQINSIQNNSSIKGLIILFTQEWIYNSTEYSMDMIKQDKIAYNSNFTNEKQRIANAISQINFNNTNNSNFKSVMMISGDARMLAFDNGTNNQYGYFPYAVCGSLDQSTNCYGGPFSHGYFFYETSQYCKIQIYQISNNVCFLTQGIYNNNNLTQIVFQFDTCNPNLYPGTNYIKCPILWQEKLICAGITLGIVIFIFILFYVVFYKIAVYNFNYKIIQDTEEIRDSNKKLEKTD